MKPILDLRENVGYLHYFTKDTALETLRYAGYEILDYFYTPKGIDFPGHSTLFKIPRKVMFKFNQDITVRILGGYSLMVLAK